MNAYRKPSGVYIELGSNIPVSRDFVQVALRPSALHTFADGWNADPLNPVVCWRLKTPAEQTAEKDAEFQAFLDSPAGKAFRLLATMLVQKAVCTLAELRTLYRTL